ncbi:unnamed protein product, partial [Symbiodinium pilosum]
VQLAELSASSLDNTQLEILSEPEHDKEAKHAKAESKEVKPKEEKKTEDKEEGKTPAKKEDKKEEAKEEKKVEKKEVKEEEKTPSKKEDAKEEKKDNKEEDKQLEKEVQKEMEKEEAQDAKKAEKDEKVDIEVVADDKEVIHDPYDQVKTKIVSEETKDSETTVKPKVSVDIHTKEVVIKDVTTTSAQADKKKEGKKSE